MKRNGINIEHSKALYGIAVVMMVLLHSVGIPERAGAEFTILCNYDGIKHIAWTGKMCVSIFAFLSGYGICTALKDYPPRAVDNIRYIYIYIYIQEIF